MAESTNRRRVDGRHENNDGTGESEEDEEFLYGEDEEDSNDQHLSLGNRGRKLRRNVRDKNDESKQIARGATSSRSPKRDFFVPEPVTISNRPDQFPQIQQDPSRPTKTFDEMCRDDEAKKSGRKIYSGPKTTMDDFDFKPGQRNKNETQPIFESFYTISILLVVMIIACFAALSQYSFSDSHSTSVEKKNWEDSQKKLEVEIKRLHKVFPSQNVDTMIHILSAIDSTLRRQEPKQPSCLVLLVPPKLRKSSFPLCFAQRFSKLTNEIFSEMNATNAPSTFTMDSNYFQKYGKDITEIHNQLKDYFRSGGRGIIVLDVEKIKEESLLLVFHVLCDNYHALEKRATLFFIVPVPQDDVTNEWNNKIASELSYSILDKAWKSATNDDSRPSMIARVAASVALLNEGDSC